MSEEMKTETPDLDAVEAVTEPKAVEAEAETAEPVVVESMEDYAAELEASFKAFDERRNRTYVEEDNPNAELWQQFKQMQVDKTTVKVKIKEIVKGGAIAYLEEMKAFIPASQLSLEYIENLEEWVGKSLEVRVITAEPEGKRQDLSAKEILKERQAEEKSKKLAIYKAGDVVDGTVDSLKPYGAFVNLEDGLSGLLHISQISNQRIKHPGAVLKEGQQIKAKILSVAEGKISLSMKALEPNEEAEPDDFHYQGDEAIATGLGALLKGLKF